MQLRVVTLFVVGWLVCCVPSVAFAGDGGEASWGRVIFHALNLVALLWIIIHFARKPLQQFLKSRAESVSREIDEARRLQSEASSKLDEYDKKLGSLKSEADSLLDDLKREGEAEKERLIGEAEQEAKRIERDAKLAAANEVRRAKARLEAELVDRAVGAAMALLGEKIDNADRRRLTAEYLKGLEDRSEA